MARGEHSTRSDVRAAAHRPPVVFEIADVTVWRARCLCHEPAVVRAEHEVLTGGRGTRAGACDVRGHGGHSCPPRAATGLTDTSGVRPWKGMTRAPVRRWAVP